MKFYKIILVSLIFILSACKIQNPATFFDQFYNNLAQGDIEAARSQIINPDHSNLSDQQSKKLTQKYLINDLDHYELDKYTILSDSLLKKHQAQEGYTIYYKLFPKKGSEAYKTIKIIKTAQGWKLLNE